MLPSIWFLYVQQKDVQSQGKATRVTETAERHQVLTAKSDKFEKDKLTN